MSEIQTSAALLQVWSGREWETGRVDLDLAVHAVCSVVPTTGNRNGIGISQGEGDAGDLSLDPARHENSCPAVC